MCQPEMKRSHVQAERYIIGEPFLQLSDNPQGMNRVLGVAICILDSLCSFRRKSRKESLNIRAENHSTYKVFERRETCCNVAEYLHGWRVEVIEVRSNCIDVNDLRGPSMVPDRWVVFNRIITDGDDHVCGCEQFIARRVSQLPHSSRKVMEQITRDRAGSLKSPDDGSVAL